MRGVTARVLPFIDNAKIGLEMWADKIGSWTPRSIEKIAARQVPAVQRLGGSLLPRLASAMPAVKAGAPLAIVSAAYTGLEGWR